MPLASTTQTQNATKNRIRISRSRPAIANKVISFQELTSLKKTKLSEREATSLLEIPRATMQSWTSQKMVQEDFFELMEFISTPGGQKFLQRVVMAAYQTLHFGCGGIRSMQEFLELSRLDLFVASSEGALQNFSVRCESFIVSFGTDEEKRLAEKMKGRKITAALDEMFRRRYPCLVAIEIVSGYILLEKFTENRTAETWRKEMQPRFDTLNISLDQVVSDLCGGIRACARTMGAIHVPELFHIQHEITKATAGALNSQEREFAEALSESEEKLKKIAQKHGERSEKFREAQGIRNLKEHGYERRRERRQKVKSAKKEFGKIHHPIDLQTGKLQTAEQIKERFDDQLKIIEQCANEAELSQSSKKRLIKARKGFEGIVEYLKYFFIWYVAFVNALKLDTEQEPFFQEVIFPLSYLKMIWRRLSREEREELKGLKECLERKLDAATYAEPVGIGLMARGRECAEKFQRSSSCVEGRNGMLSLYHHRFHRLNERGIKALTVMHNFHIKREDGKTAAERFFNQSHKNLFESLVENVRIPGGPRLQNHDITKRLNGWAKRRSA
jgi:hypothetical protein